MSEQQDFAFGKFVPGFDFLKNLAKGTTQPQAAIPGLSSWVAPTLNVEELDKRIGELKAVSFWLDQNAKALSATIQALELQKMTLATLKGMNFNMGEIADALKLNPAGGGAMPVKSAGEQPAPASSVAGAAMDAVAKARAGKKSTAAGPGNGQPAAAAATGVVDPLQWWGALTQQFQQIAAGALQEANRNPAVGAVDLGALGKSAGGAGKSAPATGKSAAAKQGTRKRSARGH